MTSVDEHIKKIKEHLEEIEDAINQGIETKPITIGFHCSACSMELLELYLHIINKISVGHIIKHDWFKKPKLEQKKDILIDRKLKVDFNGKNEIYNLIYLIEEKRENLIYGKSNKKNIESVLNSFLNLKTVLFELLSKEGIKIE